jgi:hypothetical protein
MLLRFILSFYFFVIEIIILFIILRLEELKQAFRIVPGVLYIHSNKGIILTIHGCIIMIAQLIVNVINKRE